MFISSTIVVVLSTGGSLGSSISYDVLIIYSTVASASSFPSSTSSLLSSSSPGLSVYFVGLSYSSCYWLSLYGLSPPSLRVSSSLTTIILFSSSIKLRLKYDDDKNYNFCF